MPSMSNAFFSDLLTSISERGRTLLRRGLSEEKPDADGLIGLCAQDEAVLRGECFGTQFHGASRIADQPHDST